MYRPQDAPRYVLGFVVVIITSAISCVLMIAYRVVCAYDNKKRDAAGIMEAFDNAYDDDLTDKKVCPTKCYMRDAQVLTEPQNPQFRYIL